MATKKTTKEKAFNIYGVRATSNANYYSLTLCRGEDKPDEWINTPIKAEKIRVKDGYAYIKVKYLEPKKKDEVEAKDLPF